MKIIKSELESLINEEVMKLRRIKAIKQEKKMIEEQISALNETGEWSDDEEDIVWKEALKNELELVKNMLNPGVHFSVSEIRGFDKYQGPYAMIKILDPELDILKTYKVWTTENNGLWIENFPIDNTSAKGNLPGFEGNSQDVADAINKRFSMALSLNEKDAVAPVENKNQEIYDEIEMRMRPTDDTLPFDEINEIAEENDVDFEDVVEIMTKYVLDRNKKIQEELKDNVWEVINTSFNGHTPASFQEFYHVFNSINWENDYKVEEVKKIFDVLTKDPSQLALFERKKK